MVRIEAGEKAERGEVAEGDGSANRCEAGLESGCFATLVEGGSREATENDVCCDEVNKNEATILEAVDVAFEIGGFEGQHGGIELCDREIVSP